MLKILARIGIVLGFAGLISLAWFGASQIPAVQTALAGVGPGGGPGGFGEHIRPEAGFSGGGGPMGAHPNKGDLRGFSGDAREGGLPGEEGGAFSLIRLLPGMFVSLLQIGLLAAATGLIWSGLRWIVRKLTRRVAPPASA